MVLENAVFNVIRYFILRNFCSTANLLTVIPDRIARVVKTSGATQAAVLDISKTFYVILHTGLLLTNLDYMAL